VTTIEVLKRKRAWRIRVNGQDAGVTFTRKHDAQDTAFAQARTMRPAQVHVMVASDAVDSPMLYRANTYSFK
jgi:hypothetical protein